MSCLFHVLSIPAEPKLLEQATAIMQKIHAQKNPALDATLCRQAAAFFSSQARGGSAGTNQGAKSGIEAFSDQIILALLSQYDYASAPESARRARVELGSVLARSTSLTNEEGRARLASILDMWHQSERSRPLRDEIAKAITAVRSRQ